MEKATDPINPVKPRFSIDIHTIMVYIGIVSFLITFWQGYRDIHKDMSDIKERTAKLETQYGHDDRLKKIEEKLK